MTPAPVRILVVDDSVVIRKLLTTTLGEVPGLEVVATASHGKLALAKLAQCNPDIVILDVEMPEMDGIETLKRLRKEWPRLPVIMFSTRTERGAAATIEALTSGASDYVTKPSNSGSAMLAMARVREEMVPKILALTGNRAATARPPASPGPFSAAQPPSTATLPVTASRYATTVSLPNLSTVTVQLPTVAFASHPTPPTGVGPPGAPTVPGMAALANPFAAPGSGAAPGSPPGSGTASAHSVTSAIARPLRPTGPPATRAQGTTANPLLITDGPIRLHRSNAPRPPVEIVAIGASTGGPNALSTILGQLPADFSLPVVIVQHMLATFTRHFAERLATQCRIKIVEASAGEPLAPGCVYIARGDHHLLVDRRGGKAVLAMNQEPVENFCRPAVDVLFRSVAHGYGPGVLAVLLTGMGHDGLLGCSAVRDAGGDIIVQDEASSVVWGMPGFVARAGLASQVLSLDQLTGELRRRAAHGAARAVEAAP